MGYYVPREARQTMTELTENGLDLTDDLIDVNDMRSSDHLTTVEETGTSVVFADTKGYELNEFAELLGIDRGALSERMHDLAGELADYNWGLADPIVVAK